MVSVIAEDLLTGACGNATAGQLLGLLLGIVEVVAYIMCSKFDSTNRPWFWYCIDENLKELSSTKS